MIGQLVVNAVVAGAGYSLIAVGFSLVYGTARFFHFAHAAVFTWAAYIALALTLGAGAPLMFAIPAAVGGGALLGMLMEFTIYRPLRARATPLVMLVASLGMYIVLQNLISLAFGDATQSLRRGAVAPGVVIWDARVTPVQIAIVITATFLVGATALFLRCTRLGKALRALASDSELAHSVGIDGNRLLLLAFALGSFLAAIAGVLTAMDVDMTPTMGMNALLMAVAAAIAGGVGSIPGAAVGGLLVGFAQHLGVWKIGTQWQHTVIFLVMLAFLILRPQGIFGQKLRKAEI